MVTAMNAGGRVHLKFGVMVAVLAGGIVKAALPPTLISPLQSV